MIYVTFKIFDCFSNDSFRDFMLTLLFKIFSKMSTMLFKYYLFFFWLFKELIKALNSSNISFMIYFVRSFILYFKSDLNITLVQSEWDVDEHLNFSLLKYICYVLFDVILIIFCNFVLLLTTSYSLFELIFWIIVLLSVFFILSILNFFFNVIFNCRWDIIFSLQQFFMK